MTRAHDKHSPSRRLRSRISLWLVILVAAATLLAFIALGSRLRYSMTDGWISYEPTTLAYIPRFTYKDGKTTSTAQRWYDASLELTARSRAEFTTLQILGETVAFNVRSTVEEFTAPTDAPSHLPAAVYAADIAPTKERYEGLHGIPPAAWDLSQRASAGTMTAKRNLWLLAAWPYVPMLLVTTIIAALLVLLVSALQLRKFRRLGKCPGCGYSRRGLGNRPCPECNTPEPIRSRVEPRPAAGP
jgi:hypothetical protein